MADSQNYIMYRTKPLMQQPQYTYVQGATPEIPPPVVYVPAGYVANAQQMTSLDGVVAPYGFAYALDADGKYPIGSIYTPPADADTSTS